MQTLCPTTFGSLQRIILYDVLMLIIILFSIYLFTTESLHDRSIEFHSNEMTRLKSSVARFHSICDRVETGEITLDCEPDRVLWTVEINQRSNLDFDPSMTLIAPENGAQGL